MVGVENKTGSAHQHMNDLSKDRWRSFFALAAGFLLLGLSGCASRSQVVTPSSTSTAPMRSISLKDCQLSAPGITTRLQAQCGSLQVPENWSAPSSKQITLHLALLPAISRSPQPDAVVLLAGGPGQAATETFSPVLAIFNQVRQNRDIVLLDQRGTGQSNPLRCPPGQNGLFDPDVNPDLVLAQVKTCLAQLPGDPRYYTTLDAIQDLDAVRQALGYTRLNLIGVSYGTRLALAYLHQYPTQTRLAILDGVTPMDWSLGEGEPASAQRAIDLIFERCASEPACQNAFPHLRSEFQTVLATLKDKPVQVTLPDPTTGEPAVVDFSHQKLAETIQNIAYTPESVALLPLLIHTAFSTGDYQLLAAQYLVFQDASFQSVDDGMYLSVVCSEDVPFYPTPPAAQAASYLPDPIPQQTQACQAWPHADLPASFKAPVHSDLPVLLLSGEADPITPPENAARAARTLSNSLQVVAPGMGHNVFFRGCIPALVNAFVETGTIHGLNTACVAEMKPLAFFTNFSGPSP